MNRRSAIRNLGFAGAVSLLRRLLSAGQDAGPDGFTIRSDVRLVLLDVSVKDRDGRSVPGLSADRFRVFENGVVQPITVFAHEDLPVTVGILVDESRSMTPKRAEVLSAAETFIEYGNPQDEIFVLNFNDGVKRGLTGAQLFSSDIRQLRSALDRGTPTGKTALYDAVVEGLDQLELGRRDKKSLVIISDGGDTASRRTRRQMLDRVERSVATVYAIGLFEANNPDRDPGILVRLAGVSGGEAYFPPTLSLITEVCLEIALDIRTRYTLGYVPPAVSGSGSLRRIRVNVTASGHDRLTARTRTSYRFQE